MKKRVDAIRVIGAREHNLKNISIDIPKNKLTVITGPSGSGKSSLAMDVLYTEGKRRYTESLSAYARQFLGIARKPDVDSITGLCPAIAIEQKSVGSNPRSTVGTVTEIYDYLRVLFARIGKPRCPACAHQINQESPEGITALVMQHYAGKDITIAAPLVNEKKGEFVQLLTHYFNNGYYRFTIDGAQHRLDALDDVQTLKLKKTHAHTIDLLIDQVSVVHDQAQRVQEAIEKSFELTSGSVKIMSDKVGQVYSSQRMCLSCNISFPELEPRLFSFNSPIGACTKCHGLGVIHEWPWAEGGADAWKSQYPDFFGKYATIHVCSACDGKRLNEFARAVFVGHKTIDDIAHLSIKDAVFFFKKINCCFKS